MLLVLALAVVIAVRSGDTGRRETGATVGKQWVGAAGISRSVGALQSTPVHATEPASEPDAEREPLGPAASQQAGQRVREKPEPEDEGFPQRRPHSGAPLQRVGESALSPESSLSAGTSFLGAQVSESNFIPPDSMGSVGPTQILVSVNGRIKVFDKQGTLGGLNLTDGQFWSTVLRPSAQPTDPGVEYDRLTGRWIVSAVDVKSGVDTNNLVMLAVSSGSTITSKSSFTFYSFPEATPLGGTARFADYPQLGVDANAIYIGVNLFTSTAGTFAGTAAYVIQKSSVTGGGPIAVTGFPLVASASAAGPDSPQPATDMDPTVADGYIVGPDNATANQLDVRRISNPGGASPTISGNLTLTVPATAQPNRFVPAQGTTGGLDALDDRLFEAMIARGPNGSDTLWTAHNILVNSSGIGTSSGDRDAARWYQLSIGPSPGVLQSGTLFDPAASNPQWYWIPSIAMNGQGNVSLNSSVAGTGRFAQIAASGRLAGDPSGTTQSPDIVQTSSSTYNLGSANPQRWGDYSQTVVDPTDDMTFWTFQEYANATNSWGVRAIKLKPPPPATPSAASPGTIPTGQSSVTVQLTGTQVNGSGFFDPGSDPGGPGWANHISASVTGGVTVNGVTYVDPTHVTLDLNTSGASNGSKDVTITNPDGQSTTGSNVLVVGTPDPPALTGTNPASPANNNSPKILGAAAAGTTVKLFTNSSCSGSPVATGTAAAFASPGISVSVADDTTTTFYATVTDASTNASSCSSTLSSGGSITYVEDSTPPAAPSITSTNPASPSSSTTPKVIGTSSSDTSTVQIFTQANCGGSVQASASKATFESTGIQVTVGANQATTLSAAALDAAGNPSSCSNNLSYTNDSTPPAAPTGLVSSPASPANNNNPVISGTAEAGSTVKLFTNSSCSGGPTATGSAATFASPGIPVTVPDNSTTTFYASATDAAGNTSPCSTGVAYTEDSAPPAAPTGLTSSPTSPANNNSPKILGGAEAGSTVKIYTDAACTAGNLAATGSATTFASPGIAVSVSDDTTTTFHATATDAAGNTSTCSSSNVTYVEDSTAPSAPTGLAVSPTPPANNNNPVISGTAEAGSTVKLFTNSSCSGSPAATGSAATFASPGIAVTVADNTTTTFYTTATDAAGNTSTCSSSNVTYVEDSTAPSAPTGLAVSPTPPANNNNPVISGTAEAGSTVKLFTNSSCSGSPAATGAAATFASPGIAVSVSDDTTTTLYATATDAAGNTSTCSSSNVTYTEDSAPPAAPTGLTSSPTSPANNNSPKILGSAEAGSTVRIYTDAACSPGNLAATGTAAAFASPGITVTVPDNSTTTFYATATDAAGNPSSCSSSNVTYQEDSNIPVAPTVTGTAPTSPANDSSPRVFGTAPPNTTVTLYTDQNCVTEAGNPPPSGSSSMFASPGITVSVPANSITTLYARATDVANNVSACSTSSVIYVEDSTPPTVGVTGGPSGTTSDTTPTFTFSGSDAMGPVSFQCSIDTGTAAFRACSGPGNSDKPASPLADGGYTFRVRATDAAGNSAVGTRSFAVSALKAAAPPDTTITKAPKKKTTKRRPKFKFTSNEAATFECQLDSGPFRACSSPFLPPKLRLGKHVFRVRAVNQTGTADLTPPARKFRVVR